MNSRMIPLALLLTACDPMTPPQPETAPNPAFESQVQALEKARAVEGQVNQAADLQHQQVDEASR